MSDFEQFHVNNFDQFCKTLLKNEAKNAWRAINKQRDREITAGTAEDMAWLLMQIVMAYDLTKQTPTGEPNEQ